MGESGNSNSFHNGHVPRGGRQLESYQLTEHAILRICGRRISLDAVKNVIIYGRMVHVRGAAHYVIGRREVSRFSRYGVDLRDFEGIHVVCVDGGIVVTAYRNHDLRCLRGYRTRRFTRSGGHHLRAA